MGNIRFGPAGVEVAEGAEVGDEGVGVADGGGGELGGEGGAVGGGVEVEVGVGAEECVEAVDGVAGGEGGGEVVLGVDFVEELGAGGVGELESSC